jgi:hypothetical protein
VLTSSFSACYLVSPDSETVSLSSSCFCSKLPSADARTAEALNEDQETDGDGKLDGHVNDVSSKSTGF